MTAYHATSAVLYGIAWAVCVLNMSLTSRPWTADLVSLVLALLVGWMAGRNVRALDPRRSHDDRVAEGEGRP